MAVVIGREKEVQILKNALASDKSELIVLYGRRRVGKTFLIRETYAKEIVLEVSGIHKVNFKTQRTNFYNEIVKKLKRFSKRKVPTDWMEAFAMLGDYIDTIKGAQKKVVFIDEFPWMNTHKSSYVPIFAHFWNNYCSKRRDLVVVICGSAASFMINKVINDKGGLHNRISYPIRLLPFNLRETEMFLKSKKVNLDKYDYLRLYMAIEGIPHYLEKINSGDSVPMAIDRLCFKTGGVLVNEFNIVFPSLFDNSQNHTKVVEALANVQQGMDRGSIIKKSGVKSGGTISTVLLELIESGFVTEYRPFGKRKKEKLYRLSDEYSLFYLKYIKNNSGGSWTTLSSSRSYSSWSGFAFENLCLKHVEQIKKALGLSGIYSENYCWRNRNAQIDLLIDRNDRSMNICEMKFSNTQFTIGKKDADNLRNKKAELTKELTSHKNIFITMVTTFGVANNAHSNKVMDNQIMMNSLFDKL